MNVFRQSRGFTLVELLVVIVIIGVMALVILTSFGTGSDMVRVKTASRGVMQMTRYARTMAVLYQTPMELVVSSDGELRIARRGGSPGSVEAMTAEAGAQTGAADAEAAGAATVGTLAGDAESGTSHGDSASYEMADLDVSKRYEGVVFLVALDEDALEEDERDTEIEREEGEESGGTGGEDVSDEKPLNARVLFESNGRCLPFVVKVQAWGEDAVDALTVSVDRFGVARVLDEDE